MDNAKERTRAYFDQLYLEMRLIGAVSPDTTMQLYGEEFNSPVMTAALSHMGTFFSEADTPMIQYARGAKEAGCVHWIGMCEEEEFEAVIATGARTIRIIKPYADESKIRRQLLHAKELGALAVGMDIDHMFDENGNRDVPMGEEMSIKTPAMLRKYIQTTDLPFIIKGVLSVKDARKSAELGAKGVKDTSSFDTTVIYNENNY